MLRKARPFSASAETGEGAGFSLALTGAAPPAAVESLCAALSGFAEERVPLAYVHIGGKHG